MGWSMKEAELLKRIRAIFDQHSQKSDLVVGNGDDGAVIAPRDSLVVLATDVAVEGVHFRSDWSSPFDIGRKITAANLADICAMGGWPEYLLVSAVIPPSKLPSIEDLARGISEEAGKVGAAIVGGDLATGTQLTISIAAIGYSTTPIQRSGALIGDLVVVSHIPGWSAAGLELLRSGRDNFTPLEKRAISQHRSPEIPYGKYRATFPALHCATDISDGLVIDASHIATASEVSIELERPLLRDDELSTLGDPLPWILGGGEDHVLLGTAVKEIPGFTTIGRVVNRGESSVLLDGKPIEVSGFQHDFS